jgi:flagellar protein FlaG
MPINSIDSPALDFAVRESPQAQRQRRNSGPPAAAPAAAAAPLAASADTDAEAQLDQAAQAQQQQQQQVAPPKQTSLPNLNLKFSSDEETGKAVVALVDPVSGEVLRQVPTEEALEVAKAIGRYQGMFVDTKA